MEPKFVKLNSYFSNSISTRVAVQNLFATLSKMAKGDIVFDFSDIHFISSSAAHQFIIETRKLEKQNITVTLINMSKDVERMLELAKTDRKNIFTVQDIKHHKISTDQDLSIIFL